MENDLHIKINTTNGILKYNLEDSDGNDTGEKLIFDLEDIELPIKLQECIEAHKKNMQELRNAYIIIDKKEDHKGKKLLSSNEEAKIEKMIEFYDKEAKALDLFIGEGKTDVILKIMGRKRYYEMFNDIMELLDPVLENIKEGYKTLNERLNKKYLSKEENVIE